MLLESLIILAVQQKIHILLLYVIHNLLYLSYCSLVMYKITLITHCKIIELSTISTMGSSPPGTSRLKPSSQYDIV